MIDRTGVPGLSGPVEIAGTPRGIFAARSFLTHTCPRGFKRGSCKPVGNESVKRRRGK